MSHQTGIKANDSLKKFFGKCREGKIRVFKISIENEELTLSAYKDVKSTWEKDYDKKIKPLVEENKPCYIFYRLDTKNASGYEWLLISWIPDTATVREKMLYASTKATLKQEFGTGYIKEEIHGTTLDDVTLSGYQRYKTSAKAPAPLTSREEELQELRKSELSSCTDYSVDSRQQTLGGVSFPMTESAKQAILDMARGSYDYLQFRIEIEEERIDLVTASNISLEKLPSQIPEDTARYHLYKFKHTHEGDYLENIVFIYSMPGYNCSIKERMLYSSCKAPFLVQIENMGLEIEKKLEIESGSELTEDYLQDEIHPKKNLHRPKFAKPKGPPNRGAKRLTKTTN
ncbi:twinfilin [Chrysoperla carnea]|uniref:twinfilin n=1 Tax=Chrysoperla carnea TaxID=189513 RepID=UPI001D09474B|nr:twinfilin [Chrysoperla carnea]